MKMLYENITIVLIFKYEDLFKYNSNKIDRQRSPRISVLEQRYAFKTWLVTCTQTRRKVFIFPIISTGIFDIIKYQSVSFCLALHIFVIKNCMFQIYNIITSRIKKNPITSTLQHRHRFKKSIVIDEL